MAELSGIQILQYKVSVQLARQPLESFERTEKADDAVKGCNAGDVSHCHQVPNYCGQGYGYVAYDRHHGHVSSHEASYLRLLITDQRTLTDKNKGGTKDTPWAPRQCRGYGCPANRILSKTTFIVSNLLLGLSEDEVSDFANIRQV